MDVDTIKERSGNLPRVSLDLRRRASAHMAAVLGEPVAAGTGIHLHVIVDTM